MSPLDLSFLDRLHSFAKETDVEIPADLQVLASGIEADASGAFLDHCWFQLVEEDNGTRFRGYRVIRLFEMASIPLDARADSGLLQKMRTVLRSLYGSDVSLVYLVMGNFSDGDCGIRQCYGVAATSPILDQARQETLLAASTLRSSMTGSFRQLKLAPLSLAAGREILAALQSMQHALVVVGQPDPRENSRGGSSALSRNPIVEGNATSQQFSLQQNEILFRGMSALREDFLFLVMTSPLALSEISRMLVGLAEFTSTWASVQGGVRGTSFGVSLPAMVSGVFSSGTALATGSAEAEGHGTALSHSQGQSETQGTAHAEGQAETAGWSHSLARGLAVTDSVATSSGHAVTDTTAHSEGVTNSQGLTQTSTSSGSETTSSGVADSLGGGASLGADAGLNLGVDAGLSGGMSTNFNHTQSSGSALSSGWSEAQAVSESQSTSVLDSTSHAETDSTSTTIGQAVTRSAVESFGESGAITHSSMDTTSSATSRSQAEGSTESASVVSSNSQAATASQGLARGLSLGAAPSLSIYQSYQWQSDPAMLVTQILRTQEKLLETASREGAFYCDTYALARTLQGKQALRGLIAEAFHGTEEVVTGVQTRPLAPMEEDYIRRHMAVFSPSTRMDRNPDLFHGYLDATVLTLLQAAAYTAPGMFELGSATTVQESTPDFAYYPGMPGEVVLGRQWSSELAELTPTLLRLSREKHFHTAFCGDTGFGKSVSAERLAYETTLRWHYRTIVLDFGQGWRRALNWAGLEKRVDVRQIFPGAERPLRWNILQVPTRMDPGRYRSLLAELFCNAGQMGARQLGFLRRALSEIYEKYGVLASREREGFQFVQNAQEAALLASSRGSGSLPGVGFPLSRLSADERHRILVERSKRAAFSEVVARLRAMQGELARSDQTSRTSLEGLLLRLEIFEESEMVRQYGPGPDSLPIESLGLLESQDDPWGLVVIEGGAEMSDEFAKSALLSLLASVLYFDAVTRRRESLSGRHFPPMQLFFEEANKILSGVSSLSAGNEGPGARSRGVSEIFQTMWRDGRKYGIFLHPVVQTISDLPDGILSSCNNIFIVQTKNPRDRDMVIAHIGRSEKGFVNTEYKRYLARIPLGMAIVKLGYQAEVTQLEPILVSPLRVPGEEPSDREILARLGTADCV